MAVKNIIGDAQTWIAKTKKAINEREKAAAKTAAGRRWLVSKKAAAKKIKDIVLKFWPGVWASDSIRSAVRDGRCLHIAVWAAAPREISVASMTESVSKAS